MPGRGFRAPIIGIGTELIKKLGREDLRPYDPGGAFPADAVGEPAASTARRPALTPGLVQAGAVRSPRRGYLGRIGVRVGTLI